MAVHVVDRAQLPCDRVDDLTPAVTHTVDDRTATCIEVATSVGVDDPTSGRLHRDR